MAAIEPLPLPLAPDALSPEVEAWVSTDADDEDYEATAPTINPMHGPRYAASLIAAHRERAYITAQYEQRRAELDLWKKAAIGRIDGRIGRTEFLLGNLLYALRQLNPKAKHLDLPGVRVQARKAGGDFKRVERAEQTRTLTAWAVESAPECVQTEPKLLWAELKKRLRRTSDGRIIFADTGEALPDGSGVVYEDEHEEFSVKVAAEGDA